MNEQYWWAACVERGDGRAYNEKEPYPASLVFEEVGPMSLISPQEAIELAELEYGDSLVSVYQGTNDGGVQRRILYRGK